MSQKNKGKNMIVYIGFSNRSHKIIARILCRHFKHCAPIIIRNNRCDLYQFTKLNKIKVIHMQKRDLNILGQYGWMFVKYNVKKIPRQPENIRARTCVQFTKAFCGIKNKKIQTPYSLFKYVK